MGGKKERDEKKFIEKCVFMFLKYITTHGMKVCGKVMMMCAIVVVVVVDFCSL